MDHQSLARVFLALLCCLQGAGSVLIDLNRTHATHPGWLGHARFHVVWQASTVLVMSAFAIGLVLVRGPNLNQRFYVAAVLAAAPMLGFFAAFTAQRLYGGTLSDPGGIPPVVWRLRGRQLKVDLNLVAEIVASATLAVIVMIYRWG